MKFVKFIFKLSHTKRYNGKNLYHEYNVAEHSFRVAALSGIIVDRYNIQNPDKQISKVEVYDKALYHDFEEGVLGDMPSPAKKYIGRDQLRVAGKEVMRELLSKLDKCDYYLKMWEEDKDGESGEIIKLADTLEALLAATFEVMQGNIYLEEAFCNIMNWFFSKEGKRLINKFTMVRDILEEEVFNFEFNSKIKGIAKKHHESSNFYNHYYKEEKTLDLVA